MEMLTVAIIVGIFAALVFPDSSTFFAMQKAASQASVLISDIRLARSWAMSNQSFTRLVFADDLSGWVVQEHTNADGTPVIGEPVNPNDAAHTTYADASTIWGTIIDGEAQYLLEPDIQVKVTPNVVPKVFFGPDGVLRSKPTMMAPPVGCLKIQFGKNDIATMDVDISPAGALESTEYYSEYY
jgi:type II secretory pathway pseudopilin PulG